MKAFALPLAGLLLCSAAGAATVRLKGTPEDLDRAILTRAAKIGNVASATGPLAREMSTLPKGALVRAAFNFVDMVQREGSKTLFVGHHLAGSDAFDLAVVSFPGGVEISTRSSSVVIGSFAGTRDLRLNGAKATVPLIEARVVGVIDGVAMKDGRPTYPPRAAIRVYDAAPKKEAARKP